MRHLTECAWSALLIMSIGLVALAVLFPLSVLRSIKASQFTNATDVRYNAEAAIDQFRTSSRIRAELMLTGPETWPDGVCDACFDPSSVLGYAIVHLIDSPGRRSLPFGDDSSARRRPSAAGTAARSSGGIPMTWGNSGPNFNTAKAERASMTLPDSWVPAVRGIFMAIRFGRLRLRP